MKKIFRPVEFWKSAVMTMPDNSFFELLRSVFGKIKTPFNKQQLINELEIFLLREDIQAAITTYIDQNDAMIISAVALFGEPAPGELESFFSGELSYAELQDIIVNLEERFILYRFTKDNISRLALNPILENVLLPFTADNSTLFPAISKTEESGENSKVKEGNAVLNDRILAGLLSFVSQEEPFFRGEGVIRKKVVEAGKICFPGIDLEFILGGLQILGLFYIDGDRLVPDKKHFDDFGLLSARERMEYCAASFLVFEEIKNPLEILPPLYKARIRDVVNFIHCFFDSLKAGFLYPEKTLKRLIEVIKAESGTALYGGALLNALEKTGLLATQNKHKQLGEIAHNSEKEKGEGPFIAVDSGFSVLVYPEIKFADAIALAAVLNIREAGAVVRFEMDKESAVRSFTQGIRANEIIDLLKRLSGGRIDDTLVWNLKDWEKRYGEVTLKKGIVLSLSPERRYLAETSPLEKLIEETLAPGIYLLGENAMEDAAAAIRSAGIDIIGQRREKSRSLSTGNYFASPSLNASCGKKLFSAEETLVKKERNPDLIANFHDILKKLPLGEADRAELSARIDRRLVLCESQLKDASLRYEKLEARNMDYAGKQNIAKQAIAQQSPVEIVWTRGKKEERIFGVPKMLEKDAGEQVLVVVPAEDDDVMRIPLGKMSLLRRIKKSIFEV